jgi:hypothetical protein
VACSTIGSVHATINCNTFAPLATLGLLWHGEARCQPDRMSLCASSPAGAVLREAAEAVKQAVTATQYMREPHC